jgi:hypothetical protein
MSWLTGQHGASTYICPEHRYVTKSNDYSSYLEGSRLSIQKSFNCPTCREPLIDMGTKWRAPKKKNDKAWHMIEAGFPLWDKKAVDKQDYRASDSTEYSNYRKWREANRRKRDRPFYTEWLNGKMDRNG